MIGSMIVNIVALILILKNTYSCFKNKKYTEYKHFFIVISIFLAFDNIMSFMTGFFPFYQIVKLSFLLWIGLPVLNGSIFIYKYYIKKLFMTKEKDIDNMLEQVKDKSIEWIIKTYKSAYGVYLTAEKEKMNNTCQIVEIESGDEEMKENDFNSKDNCKEEQVNENVEELKNN
ncbi:hypothetical protein SLOPH_1872 [Spraguea lophii 42_110]|uniref:Protein YOP1 n=1 Tax=Spraguea lophii (strain 42_110) TaxID=1358809 RepID=S7XQX6_SPRLO|nr:hypothetical protein SLOPH_1872 [Spraguea lophii 42_110]